MAVNNANFSNRQKSEYLKGRRSFAGLLSYCLKMYTDIGSAMYGFRGMFAGPAALVAASGANSNPFGQTNLAHHFANSHPGHGFLGTLGGASHVLGSPDKLPSAITISRTFICMFN